MITPSTMPVNISNRFSSARTTAKPPSRDESSPMVAREYPRLAAGMVVGRSQSSRSWRNTGCEGSRLPSKTAFSRRS